MNLNLTFGQAIYCEQLFMGCDNVCDVDMVCFRLPIKVSLGYFAVFEAIK